MSVQYIQFKNFEDILKMRAEMTPHISAIGLSDMAIYHYVKQGSLFSKKQQRSIFYFFQGLNTNPQNLSIFLRDQLEKQFNNKQSKQKIIKGQFIIYDIFKKTDCVIEINIPGNFQIYKIHSINKKQLISNNQIQMMYVSSVLRTIYLRNISWGRMYRQFKGKSMVDQFRNFMDIFVRVIQKNDIHISHDFQNVSEIKGSQACSLLIQYIKQKCIVHHAIQYLETNIKKSGGYRNYIPKLAILLAQLYNQDHKYAKSLHIIGTLLQKYANDPFLLYYQAKYMLSLMTVHQALIIVNSIVQYNHYQVWMLAAQIHIQLKNYSDALACLNHAARNSGKNAKKNAQVVYNQFEKIGKKKLQTNSDDISHRPRLMMASQNPLSLSSNIQQKYKCILQSQYWKMNESQKQIYRLLHNIRMRLENKKFQQLLENTFEDTNKQYMPVIFRKGMTESMFVDVKNNNKTQGSQSSNKNRQHESQMKYQEELPNFLQDQSMQAQVSQIVKSNRNLSIIPQLQSVIQNSQYQQKQKQNGYHKGARHTKNRVRKQMNQVFYKLLKSLLNQNQYYRAEIQQNYPKILPIYNKLRTVSKFNNFYTYKMFQLLLKTGNFKSIIILIAETLDMLEQTGVKKIQTLPYWMEKYIFSIIQEKGLKFLNQLLEKLNFYDEAVLDAIQLAKSWKIKGCTF